MRTKVEKSPVRSPGETDSDEIEREKAMDWVGDLLDKVASDLGVIIASRTWEIDGSTGDTRSYHLVVTGPRDRRTVKLFTSNELDICLFDSELQSEIHARLARLVGFLGGRADSRSATKSLRKRREN